MPRIEKTKTIIAFSSQEQREFKNLGYLLQDVCAEVKPSDEIEECYECPVYFICHSTSLKDFIEKTFEDYRDETIFCNE